MPGDSLHVKGYTVVLRYKQGAGGRLVHDSYSMVVGRAAEKLGTQHRVESSIRHSPETRMLSVTFHHGAASHGETSRLYL